MSSDGKRLGQFYQTWTACPNQSHTNEFGRMNSAADTKNQPMLVQQPVFGCFSLLKAKISGYKGWRVSFKTAPEVFGELNTKLAFLSGIGRQGPVQRFIELPAVKVKGGIEKVGVGAGSAEGVAVGKKGA